MHRCSYPALARILGNLLVEYLILNCEPIVRVSAIELLTTKLPVSECLQPDRLPSRAELDANGFSTSLHSL